jgi:hypothetical protein
MYSSTSELNSSNISIENWFKTELQRHQYGDLSNGNPLEYLNWLYKNVSPNINVGNLYASHYGKFKYVVYKIQQITGQI